MPGLAGQSPDYWGTKIVTGGPPEELGQEFEPTAQTNLPLGGPGRSWRRQAARSAVWIWICACGQS